MKKLRLVLYHLVSVLPLVTACGFSEDGLAEVQPEPAAMGGAGGGSARPRPTTGAGGAGGAGQLGTRPDPAVGGSSGPATPPAVGVPDAGAVAGVDAAADVRVITVGDAADDGRFVVNGMPVPDALMPAVSIACPAADATLRLCLRFEDGVKDESGAGRAVSAQGVSFGPGTAGAGQAVRLTAASSVRVPDGDGLDLSTFTIEAWIRLERLPTGAGRAGVVDKDARYGAFVLPDGALACSARGAVARSPAGQIPVGRWVAVACTAGADSVASWVGGRKRAEAAAQSPMGAPLQGLAIGSNMPDGDPLIGELDNLRIWSRVLPDTEICAASIGCQ